MDNATQKLTGLADTVRGVSGVSGKLSIDDMKTQVSQLGSFHDFGAIASGADVNDFTETGMYSVGDNKDLKNIPISFGVLIVIAPVHGNTYVMQLCASAADYEGGALYMRTKNGGFGWNRWSKFLKDS